MIQLNHPESLSAQGRSRDVAPGLPSPKMPQMDPMDTRKTHFFSSGHETVPTAITPWACIGRAAKVTSPAQVFVPRSRRCFH